MKSIVLKKAFVATLCMIGFISCQNTSTSNFNEVRISGTITNPIIDSVFFSAADTTFSSKVNSNGTFEISISSDTSLYLGFSHGEYSSMYVKPGDVIELSINTNEFDETLLYKGSAESSYLAKKYLIKEQFNFRSREFYLGSVDDYKAVLEGYKSSLLNSNPTTIDTNFMNKEAALVSDDVSYWLERKEQLMSKYEVDFREFMFAKKSLVDEHYDWAYAQDSLDLTSFNELMDRYKDTLTVLLANTIKKEETIQDQLELLENELKSRLERKLALLNQPKNGEAYVDFTYPNTKEEEVSLSSFMGRMVYVDVWATWCGPCKAEIPSLQTLEHDYSGKDVVFLSVSVDRVKEDWLEMVEEKELGGVQLWADGWSQITKDYAIFSIPRFMLFSADGKVISNDAPRPSNPEIRVLFDAHLTE